MIRVVIGSILGGIVQYIVGFIFWGTPLARLAVRTTPDTANANLQAALAQALTPSGTGTYIVPSPDTAQGTVLFGQGPVAMVHFNTNGFSTMSGGSLIAGLILSVVTILLIGVALHALGHRVTDFATRMKIVVLFAVATVLYFTIGMPVFNHFMPWGYWVYDAISQLLGLVAGGFVLVRWFLPRAVTASNERVA